MGRLPIQLGSTWERQCHGFLYVQRKLHRTESITAEQVQFLDRIEGWFVLGRAPDHWQQRFAAYSISRRRTDGNPVAKHPMAAMNES